MTAASDDGVSDFGRVSDPGMRPNDRIFDGGFFFDVYACPDYRIRDSCPRFYHTAVTDYRGFINFSRGGDITIPAVFNIEPRDPAAQKIMVRIEIALRCSNVPPVFSR